MIRSLLAGVLCLLTSQLIAQEAGAPATTNQPAGPASVFEMPRRQAIYFRLQLELQRQIKLKDYSGAEATCRQVLQLAPQDPTSLYNLACALALQGRSAEAITNLAESVKRGFRDAKLLKTDADIASLRDLPAFRQIAKDLDRQAAVTNAPPQVHIEPAPVSDGVAMVDEGNTAWDPMWGIFRVFFKFPDKRDAGQGIVLDHGAVGDLLRQWSEEGTAAGNFGDLYDNHDGDHSNMDYGKFPQLTRIEFADKVRALNLHSGIQVHFFYNGVVLGNSSTALVSGPFWRSQPRLALVDPRAVLLLYEQYVGNHIYFYPEHRDYDPGHNGVGDGYGDVYPANTPFFITSQGSSGSDRPFMDAVACTLAAFRPETKQFLVRTGTLMPTVQMIFRASGRNLAKPEEYLTGKAHPSVFQEGDLNVEAMVRMAHDMPSNAVPPMVQLKVVEEDEPVAGRDYFDTRENQRMFDTPVAIARVYRTTRQSLRMVVSAEGSRDLNGRKLTTQWAVLRGDPERVKITPMNKAGSVAEIVVSYQGRRPVIPESKMESSRVDVGAFVNNGTYYSAPGFVSVYLLENEKRVYSDKGSIESVDYADPEVSKNYTDPGVDLPKRWRDEYRYDDKGRCLGWARVRGVDKEEFTADGALVVSKDEQGRPLTARTVSYVPVPHGENEAATLEQRLGDEILTYTYTSKVDLIGHVKSRVKAL